MDSLIDQLGLICIAIENGKNKTIFGRTRLQKMIYFADHLGWHTGSFRLHHYGPYNSLITDLIDTAHNISLINEDTNSAPYTYTFGSEGNEFLKKFADTISNKEKVQKTQDLFRELATWDRNTLELAATLDYVEKNSPNISDTNLINKVHAIKNCFDKKDIEDAYSKLIQLRTKYL